MNKYTYLVTMRDYATAQAGKTKSKLDQLREYTGGVVSGKMQNKIIALQDSFYFWLNAMNEYEEKIDSMSIKDGMEEIDASEMNFMYRHIDMLLESGEVATATVLKNELDKMVA